MEICTFARMGLTDQLDDDEKLLANGGYGGKDFAAWMETPTGENNADQRMKQCARARHECINGWLTKFGALSKEYHHNLEKHGLVFGSIANLVQLKIMKDGPPFQVEYNDKDVPLKYYKDGEDDGHGRSVVVARTATVDEWLLAQPFDDDETSDDDSMDGLYADNGQYDDDGSDSEYAAKVAEELMVKTKKPKKKIMVLPPEL